MDTISPHEQESAVEKNPELLGSPSAQKKQKGSSKKQKQKSTNKGLKRGNDNTVAQVKIHFLGWGGKYDEWMEVTSHHLAPPYSHAQKRRKKHKSAMADAGGDAGGRGLFTGGVGEGDVGGTGTGTGTENRAVAQPGQPTTTTIYMLFFRFLIICSFPGRGRRVRKPSAKMSSGRGY